MTSFFSSKKNTIKYTPGVSQGYTSFGFQKQPDVYSNPKFETSQPHSKGRPGGGWNDDEETELDHFVKQNNREPSKKVPTIPIASKTSTKDSIDSKPASSERSHLSNKSSSTLDILNIDAEFLNEHEYENKMVNDHIAPGGMRVKQADANLSNFCTTCENLNAQIIGSLLISKTTDQINWISKARALYAIEALIKKFDNYSHFYKYNIKTLRNLNFREDESNNEQLRKVLDSVLNELEETKSQPKVQKKTVSMPLRAESASTNSTDTEEPNQKVLPTVEENRAPVKSAIYVTENLTIAPPKSVSTGNNQINPSSNSNTLPRKSVSHAQPTQTAGNTNSMATLPLNSLATSLSDLDFSSDFTPSPYNIYQLYQNRGAASLDTISPMNFQNANRNYNQAYYNQNRQFGNYGQQNVNLQVPNNRVGYSQQSPAMNNQNQYNNGPSPQQNSSQSLWQDPSVFDQDNGIDYDAEEKIQRAKQLENEKKFDSLSFNF